MIKIPILRKISITLMRNKPFMYMYSRVVKYCDQSLNRTQLYDFHIMNKAKMVPFAGFHLPLKYNNESINAEHHHTRTHCSLFDVSHMCQLMIYGNSRIDLMESLCVSDIAGLKCNRSLLSVFVNENGGIIDDFIVTNLPDKLYLVSNAATKIKVLGFIQSSIKNNEKFSDIKLQELTSYSLIALQGPEAAHCLQCLTDYSLENLLFMSSVTTTVSGISDCQVTRCGYTGEDGFEISVPNSKVVELCQKLLAQCEHVKLVGLGARDTLRLEAGLCLSGVDFDETVTPVEAGLKWTIGKRRKVDGRFPGSQIILEQLKNNPKRIRVGFKSKGLSPRNGTLILTQDGQEIGVITSGCPSPTLNCNIAMGYVLSEHLCYDGWYVLKNKKVIDAQMCSLPFVPPKYYRKK